MFQDYSGSLAWWRLPFDPFSRLSSSVMWRVAGLVSLLILLAAPYAIPNGLVKGRTLRWFSRAVVLTIFVDAACKAFGFFWGSQLVGGRPFSFREVFAAVIAAQAPMLISFFATSQLDLGSLVQVTGEAMGALTWFAVGATSYFWISVLEFFAFRSQSGLRGGRLWLVYLATQAFAKSVSPFVIVTASLLGMLFFGLENPFSR